MKIERVKITGIWNKFDIDWTLNSDVNVLAGINGSGKTTILDIIASLCYNEGKTNAKLKQINNAKIYFSNGYEIEYFKIKDSVSKLSEHEDEKVQELVNEFKKKNDSSDINQIMISINRLKAFRNGIKCSIKEVYELLNIGIVSTFDQTVHELKQITSNLDSNSEASQKSTLKTYLDSLLYDLQADYLDYLVNIGNEILAQVGREDIDVKEAMLQIQKKKNKFKELLNLLFGETGKQLDESQNKIAFVSSDNSKLSFSQLSSGEKQLLYIILTAFLQKEEEHILFMDEPEISLHIDWQRKLIQYIRELNPNIQLIIATHSPAIIMEGWLDKVFEVRDITVKSN